MPRCIHVLNGPNLNRLGKREPEVYGTTTLAEVEAMCRAAAEGDDVVFRQTNHEGQMVDWIHEAIDTDAAGIIINPAGLTDGVNRPSKATNKAARTQRIQCSFILVQILLFAC